MLQNFLNLFSKIEKKMSTLFSSIFHRPNKQIYHEVIHKKYSKINPIDNYDSWSKPKNGDSIQEFFSIFSQPPVTTKYVTGLLFEKQNYYNRFGFWRFYELFRFTFPKFNDNAPESLAFYQLAEDLQSLTMTLNYLAQEFVAIYQANQKLFQLLMSSPLTPIKQTIYDQAALKQEALADMQGYLGDLTVQLEKITNVWPNFIYHILYNPSNIHNFVNRPIPVCMSNHLTTFIHSTYETIIYYNRLVTKSEVLYNQFLMHLSNKKVIDPEYKFSLFQKCFPYEMDVASTCDRTYKYKQIVRQENILTAEVYNAIEEFVSLNQNNLHTQASQILKTNPILARAPNQETLFQSSKKLFEHAEATLTEPSTSNNILNAVLDVTGQIINYPLFTFGLSITVCAIYYVAQAYTN